MKLCLHYRPHRNFLSTGEYFERAARRLGIEIDDDSPVVLNIESGNPIFKQGKVTAVYDIDVYQNKDNPTTQQIVASDVYFATHPSDRAGKEAVVIPHGFDPELSFRSHKKYDIALSGRVNGANYGLREGVFKILRKKFNCIDIPYDTKTPKYLKELSRAKIVINVSGWKEMNRRVFDGMACGVLLVDESPHLKTIGEKGKHYHTFKNEEDVVSSVQHILDNYKKYRKHSRKHAFENHTYDLRLKKIYGVLKEIYEHKSTS